jgi:hypothetical protein
LVHWANKITVWTDQCRPVTWSSREESEKTEANIMNRPFRIVNAAIVR